MRMRAAVIVTYLVGSSLVGAAPALAQCDPEDDCPGDCAQPTDGVVNAEDLMALMSEWGTGAYLCCDDFPTTAYGLPYGDGEVNFDDLLLLLSSWGECPDGYSFRGAELLGSPGAVAPVMAMAPIALVVVRRRRQASAKR